MIPPEILDASLALGVNAIVIDPQQTDTIFAGTTKGLFKSTNMADSWIRIGTSLADQYISTVAIDPKTRGPSMLEAALGFRKVRMAARAGRP